MQLISVIKSSGVSQSFDPQKIIKVLSWACEGTSVNPYELYENIKSYLRDGMTTNDIQTIVIKVAANSISVEEPDYQYVAARCLMFALRKHAYGQYEPRSFIDHISYCVNEGKYDPELLSKYSAEEITVLESKIKHERDMEFTYSGAMQLKEKYLVKDKTTGQIYETPQFAFMAIGMALHQDEPVDRLKHVIRFYEAVSTRQISLPTPIMAGCRTPTRQFSSCVVIEAGDSLKSINKASASIVEYISKRAGIGINAGMIRAEGSKIGTGEVRHTGVIPFWKHFQTAVKSCLTPDSIVWIEGRGATKIEDVKPGMKILTCSSKTGNTYRTVLDQWETKVPKEKQIIIKFANGAIIRCSDDHKIMVVEMIDNVRHIKRKLPLELTKNDKILVGNQTITHVEEISKDNTDGRYIDITVEGTESFYTISRLE